MFTFSDAESRFVVEEPQTTLRERVVWAIARGVLVAWLIYGIMAITSSAAISQLPKVNVYLLEPQGWGRVIDITWWIVVISLCSVVYSLPGLVVRSHIGCLVRISAALIFVVIVTRFQAESCIAVVKKEDRFVFVRRTPLPERSATFEEVGNMKIFRTKITRWVEIRKGPGDYIRCNSVWRADKATSAVFDNLVTALRSASR